MVNQRAYMGRTDFVERHELRDGDEHEQIDGVLHSVKENELEVIRLSFADQHGIPC